MARKQSKAEVKFTEEEVKVPEVTEKDVITMLRGLNDNKIRLQVMAWLDRAETEIMPEPEAEVRASSPESAEKAPRPLLERHCSDDEEGKLLAMTLHFPETNKKVQAHGDAILRALHSLTDWADRMNIYEEEGQDQRFP